MEQVQKGENCIKERCFFKITAAVLIVCLFAGSGIYVWAKYYSVSAREGIAIATGIYFTANYAQKSEGEKEEFVENLISAGYKGGDTSFIFKVCNYENNLLFNTDNVTIPYTVEMWLEKEPADGTVYYVSVGENSSSGRQRIGGGEAGKVTIADQSISGGAAKANSYYVEVDTPDAEGHTPIPVYVRVKTLDGALISRTLTGKMVLSSRGKAESYIESQGFVIPDTPADKGEFDRLLGLSAFTYEIQTAGSLTAGITEKLKVSWDPEVLSIDLFDDAYREWLKDTKESGPLTDMDTGWKYITIDFVPYSAEKIVFFRGSSFETKAADMETLKKSVHAEKIVVSTE